MTTLVLGIGNLLLGDDGVGVWLVRRLQEAYRFAEPVDLLDGGTLGLELLAHVADCERLLVLDAATTGAAPGTVVVLRDGDVPAVLRSALSAHEASLCDLLAASTLLGTAPREFVAIGIEPAGVAPGIALSDAVRAALPAAEREALAQLARWGIAAEAR